MNNFHSAFHDATLDLRLQSNLMFVPTRYRFAQPEGRSPRWEGETKV